MSFERFARRSWLLIRYARCCSNSIVVQKCAYYFSGSSGVLRMDLQALEPTGPFRLIVDGATDRHVEYFDSRAAALDRWAEFDAAMRPDVECDDPSPAIH